MRRVKATVGIIWPLAVEPGQKKRVGLTIDYPSWRSTSPSIRRLKGEQMGVWIDAALIAALTLIGL
jgi:hypothetical protein